ncbi:MAG: MBL fold metallo-hydrolase [Deltaproteobacteria bacterium]|nr:MBL fold metallo-hydrolase [Deltaproteobacteria bacterium]
MNTHELFFRQLFDYETWTYTYLIADPETREAALIDTVKEQVQRDLNLVKELGLHLKFVMETHVHADHITGADEIRTNGCTSYLVAGRVFSGDALLIRGTGRTDFQQGSSSGLYESITQKLFTLPDETLVYPAHDYRGMMVSTIEEEKKFNPRVGGGKTKEEFLAIMANLKLAMPKKIQIAVPANLACGSPPSPAKTEEAPSIRQG